MPPINKWEFSKKIDIPTIVVIIGIAIGGVYKVSEIEKQVALNEQSIDNNNVSIKEVKTESQIMFTRIDAKLDKMIEIIHSYQTNRRD
jgi:uncharacterized coiled-coil protein SlyX